MSKPAKTLFVFGIYLVALGIVLIAAPNFLLSLFGVPTTDEVWIRVVGVVVLVLAFYDIQGARKEMVAYFLLTVYSRASVIVFFTAFVLLGMVKPILILFGAIDLAGAIWTALALRERRAADL